MDMTMSRARKRSVRMAGAGNVKRQSYGSVGKNLRVRKILLAKIDDQDDCSSQEFYEDQEVDNLQQMVFCHDAQLDDEIDDQVEEETDDEYGCTVQNQSDLAGGCHQPMHHSFGGKY